MYIRKVSKKYNNCGNTSIYCSINHHLSIYHSINHFIDRSVCHLMYLSICLFLYFICLSVCLSVWLSSIYYHIMIIMKAECVLVGNKSRRIRLIKSLGHPLRKLTSHFNASSLCANTSQSWKRGRTQQIKTIPVCSLSLPVLQRPDSQIASQIMQRSDMRRFILERE